jgi:small subunit ribosomal protein S16
MGSKKRPFYRLVVLERASRRDGRPLEFLGHYNPMTSPAEVVIDTANYEKWINRAPPPATPCVRWWPSRTPSDVLAGFAAGVPGTSPAHTLHMGVQPCSGT